MTENKKKVSRRKFLVKGGLGSLGLLAVGTFVFRNPLRRMTYELAETLVAPYAGSGTEANLWFEILKDNKVLLHSPKVEMGQGTFTGLAQIAADELDVDVNQIVVKAAETATGIVDMFTGGSLSIAQLYQPLRELSATVRELVKQEAAKKWKVNIADITTQNGVLTSGDQTMTYSDALADVKEWDLPSTPELRSVKDYKFVGKPIPRIDLSAKVYGDPIFGMDAEMPDMLHAAVIRPEYVGATLKSADTSEAETMSGIVKVIKKEKWVGIVAETHAQALAAKKKINVEWDIPKKWTEEGIRAMMQVGKGDKMINQKEGSALDLEDENVFSLEFKTPIGAHAQIEPNGAVAYVKDGKATVKLSTQVLGITQAQVANAMGMSKSDVNIIPTFLGGGFGRRLNTEHAIRACEMSKEVGKPVKYFFSRKEEFQHDAFRPPTHHKVYGKLDDKGNLDALEHHFASGDVMFNSALVPGIAESVLGTDLGAARGGSIMYDKIPNHRAIQWHTSMPFATSFWRSLGLLANTFAIESTIDEMAIRAGKSPVDFRVAMLSNEKYSARIKKVIQVAAEKSGYTDQVNGNRAMGLAVSIDVGSPCAHVVEVSVEDDEIKVHKVTCVLDCGLAVNPDQVKAQCEGCICMGISASMFEKMTLRDGQLFPIIYGPYEMALMRDAPKEINVHLIQGQEEPGPVGEPPLGPIAAAIGNAVRRITGKRLTELPLTLS